LTAIGQSFHIERGTRLIRLGALRASAEAALFSLNFIALYYAPNFIFYKGGKAIFSLF